MSSTGAGTPYPADRSLLGDAAARTLVPVQAFNSGGQALFALSLVGSLFFNVSVDAARPSILLYLALTMAPFAILAPLIGPVIDTLRGGHRAILLGSLVGRAAIALLLATQLKTLLLYPQAFVIVVLAKVYGVGSNALVPSLVDDRSHLVVVNSRLARVGTISGFVASGIGLVVLRVGDAAWVARLGALFFVLGAVAALRIPAQRTTTPVSPIVESTEMHSPGIMAATAAMAALRAAAGFVLFHVGFALKASGQPPWVLGAVLAAGAIAGFAGTYLSSWLHRHWPERRVLTASILAPAVVAAIAALRVHPSTIVALAIALGLAGSTGRRAFDGVIQTEAPHARRGMAYAALETRLELAWVGGSLLAVLARFPNWLGLAILAAFLGALGTGRIIERVRTTRIEARVGADTLALRLIETAEAVAARGDRQQAVAVALAAVEAAAKTGQLTAEVLDDVRRRWDDVAVGHDPAAEEQLITYIRNLVAGPEG
ncbi:MAG: hypothetical protein ACFCVK_21420 [Acidimicrobiales bacterium]